MYLTVPIGPVCSNRNPNKEFEMTVYGYENDDKEGNFAEIVAVSICTALIALATFFSQIRASIPGERAFDRDQLKRIAKTVDRAVGTALLRGLTLLGIAWSEIMNSKAMMVLGVIVGTLLASSSAMLLYIFVSDDVALWMYDTTDASWYHAIANWWQK